MDSSKVFTNCQTKAIKYWKKYTEIILHNILASNWKLMKYAIWGPCFIYFGGPFKILEEKHLLLIYSEIRACLVVTAVMTTLLHSQGSVQVGNSVYFRTFHKIQYWKNRLFTKFITRKTDSLQNSLPKKWTLHKIQNTSIKVSTICWKFQYFFFFLIFSNREF